MKQTFTLILLLCCMCAEAQPFRTPNLTGNAASDFTDNEKTSSTGTAYCMTWDASYIYLGVSGSGTYIKDEPTIIYIDTDPQSFATTGTGDTTGFNYDGRTPKLPFSANFVLFFKSNYADVRRDTVGGWTDRTEYTANVITGANDIEIKIPWTAFPGGVRPAAFSSVFFKENGNSSQQDAYEVRPGVTNPDDNYTGNINTNGPAIFYRLNTTNNRYYPGVNIFSWIDNSTSSLCAEPSKLKTKNITQTSAKLMWASVNGALQYQVRYHKKGKPQWSSTVVTSDKNYLNISALQCNTKYEWHVRTLCDTSFNSADINSGFSASKSFTTLACGEPVAQNENSDDTEDKIVLSPNPAHKNAVLSLRSSLYKNCRYVIYNYSGNAVQTGTVNSGSVALGSRITTGYYTLELNNGTTVTRKKFFVVD